MTRVAGFCIVLLAMAQAALGSAADLANMAYSAERTASYSGKMTNTVYIAGKPSASTVSVQRSRSKSRMEYLSGPLKGTLLIEDGQTIYRLDKSAETVYYSTAVGADPDLKLLLGSYNLTLAGSETIARRQAQVLRLEPKWKGSPKVKLWVDAKTGVILRNERYRYNGSLASRSEYQTISYSPAPNSAAFALPAGWKRIALAGQVQPVSAEKVAARVGFQPVKPRYVPRGYRLGGHFVGFTGRGLPIAALKYTNGLNSVSVFEHAFRGAGGGYGPGGRRGGGGMGMGRNRGGGPKAQGRQNQCVIRSDPQAEVAENIVDNLKITVMGDLAPDLLRKMAESF